MSKKHKKNLMTSVKLAVEPKANGGAKAGAKAQVKLEAKPEAKAGARSGAKADTNGGAKAGARGEAKRKDPDFYGKKVALDEAADAVEAAVAKLATKPTKTTKATQSVKSTKTKTAKTTQATKTTQSVKTAKAIKTIKVTKADQPAETTKSTRTAETTKSTKPAKPAETAGTTAATTKPKPAADKAAATPRVPKHPMPTVLRVLGSALLLMAFAFFLTWFILWRQNSNDAAAVATFIGEKPALFVYSSLILFALLAMVAAATWRVFLTLGLGFAAASILTYINAQKFVIRATPLLPEDFKLVGQAGNLLDFVDPWSVVRLVLGVILVLTAAILLERAARRTIGRDPRGLPWWNRVALVPRIAFTAVALATLTLVTQPIVRRETPEWLTGAQFSSWNQTDTYRDNGFVLGFLYNLRPTAIQAADNYNADTMNSIAETYRAKKAEDTERKPLNEVVDNLIIILDESTYDPILFEKYANQAGKDVLPTIHKIMENYPSGYMFSPEYGGNTANVEFEVQTGLSNFWLMGVPYTGAIVESEAVLSAGSWAKAFEFGAMGVHTYDGTMWQRYDVYPILGYDGLLAEQDLSYRRHENASQYINDWSLYQEALDVLEEADGPQMLMILTMQSHAPYDTADYPEIEFRLKNLEGIANVDLLEANMQSLYEADAYLGKFLDRLEALNERTVVLLFGDHAPGILTEYIDSTDPAERQLAHLTPYFVWSTFELENAPDAEATAEINAAQGLEFKEELSVDLPTVTPNCLQNMLYNLLGVEKPALFYLVDEVCEEVPVLARAYLGETEPSTSSALKAYELVNYDVLAGEHYWDGR